MTHIAVFVTGRPPHTLPVALVDPSAATGPQPASDVDAESDREPTELDRLRRALTHIEGIRDRLLAKVMDAETAHTRHLRTWDAE